VRPASSGGRAAGQDPPQEDFQARPIVRQAGLAVGDDPALLFDNFQSDIDAGLADYPDDAFDYVILSQTLQETRHPRQVLREMLRVGRRGIVAFPNFGHWQVRFSMLTSGCAPRTSLFPYEWYESPNIHFLTIHDFENLVALEGLTIERRYFLAGRRKVRTLPNLMAEVAVYLVSMGRSAPWAAKIF